MLGSSSTSAIEPAKKTGMRWDKKRNSEPTGPRHTLSVALPKGRSDLEGEDAADSARAKTREAFDTTLDLTMVTRKQSKQIWDSCSSFIDLEFNHGGALPKKVWNTEIKLQDLLIALKSDKKLQIKFASKFIQKESVEFGEILAAMPEFIENKLCFEVLSLVMPEGEVKQGSFAKNMLIDLFKMTNRLNKINEFFQPFIKGQKGSFSLWPIIYREVLPKAATGMAAAAAKGIGEGVFADYFVPLLFVSSSILGFRFRTQAKKIEQVVAQFKEKYTFLGQLLNLCYVVDLIENKNGVFTAKPELKEVDCICARVWEGVLKKFGLSSFKYFDHNKLLRFQLTMKISLIKYLIRWREEEMRLRAQGLKLEEDFKFDAKLSAFIVEKFEDLIASAIKDISRFKLFFGPRFEVKQVLATSAFDKAILEAQSIIIKDELKKAETELDQSSSPEKHTSRTEAQRKALAESLVYEQLISNFGIFKKDEIQTIYRVDKDGSVNGDKDRILSNVMASLSKKLADMEGTKSRYRAPFWISVVAGYLKGEAFSQVNKNLRKLSFLSPLFAFIGSAVYVINNFLKKLTDILDDEYFKFTKEYDSYKGFLKFLHSNKMLNISFTIDSNGISKVDDVKPSKSFKLMMRILALTWVELSEDKINPQEWVNRHYSAKDQAFISLRLLNGMSFMLNDSVPAQAKLRMNEEFLKLLAKRFAEEIKGVSSTKWKDKILKFTLKTAITSGLHAKDIPIWIDDELKKQGKTLQDFYIPIMKSLPSSPEQAVLANKKALKFIEMLRKPRSSSLEAQSRVESEVEKGSESGNKILSSINTGVDEKKVGSVSALQIPKLSRGRSFIAGGYNQVSTSSTALPQIAAVTKPEVLQNGDFAHGVTKKQLFEEMFNRGKDVVTGKKSPRKNTSADLDDIVRGDI